MSLLYHKIDRYGTVDGEKRPDRRPLISRDERLGREDVDQ